MNQLSLGARTMLGRQPQRHTITDRDAIVQQIRRAGLPVFEPIVAFQVQYGGLEYTIRGTSGSGFSFDLFLDFGPNKPRTFEATEDPKGCWSFCCGIEPRAPVTHYIRQDGAICVDGTDDIVLPIATSVEKYIESDAMRDGLMDIQATWWEFSFEIADTDHAVDAVISQGREVMDIPSDTYTTWWADEWSRIVRYRMWAVDARNRVMAYLRTRAAAVSLVQAVYPLLGSSQEVFSYPRIPEEHLAVYRREQQTRKQSS